MFMKQCLAREPLRTAHQRGVAFGWRRKREGETAEPSTQGENSNANVREKDGDSQVRCGGVRGRTL